jgi:hypothetical protein
MDELPFKMVRMQGSRDEVIARLENLKALFVYPDAHLRHGAWNQVRDQFLPERALYIRPFER